MNPIDIVVLVIVGICVLWGLYRGFLQSLLKLGGGLGSLLLSFRLYPKLSDLLSQNTGLIKLITTYTGSNSLLGNLDMSSLPETCCGAALYGGGVYAFSSRVLYVAKQNDIRFQAYELPAELNVTSLIGFLKDGKAVVACNEDLYVLTLL